MAETVNNKPPFKAHPTAVVDAGCKIGNGTTIWHFSHVMPDCEIGEDCNLGQNVVVLPGVKLGNRVKVQNNVSIYTGVVCEDEVFLGPSMVFTNITNPRSAIVRKHMYEPTLLKQGASVGANATIVCGHTLGEYCFIGAGSVVTKDVKPYALMVGNPARQLGWMSEYGHRLKFNEEGIAECPESKQCYQLTHNEVKRIK
jgi:UDP-2-acetamido-3-amino-2,3-dideoxy-glucuronate N-acetyltransferase